MSLWLRWAKNVTLEILNFILVSWIIKIFPIWCNVNFECVFTAIRNIKKTEKTYSKLTLHHMGKLFISYNLLTYNLKSGGLHFLKVFLPLRNYWMDFGFLEITETWSADASEMTCSLSADTVPTQKKWCLVCFLCIASSTRNLGKQSWPKCTMSQENLSSGFATRVDSNWPAQPQKLARG